MIAASTTNCEKRDVSDARKRLLKFDNKVIVTFERTLRKWRNVSKKSLHNLLILVSSSQVRSDHLADHLCVCSSRPAAIILVATSLLAIRVEWFDTIRQSNFEFTMFTCLQTLLKRVSSFELNHSTVYTRNVCAHELTNLQSLCDFYSMEWQSPGYYPVSPGCVHPFSRTSQLALLLNLFVRILISLNEAHSNCPEEVHRTNVVNLKEWEFSIIRNKNFSSMSQVSIHF